MAIPKKSKVAVRVPLHDGRGELTLAAGVRERFEAALAIRNKREDDDADMKFLIDHIVETYTIETLEAENDKAEKKPTAKESKSSKGERHELHAVQQSA